MGFTQECLAEMVGIHWKTLGYIESGKRDFSVLTLSKLIECLKRTPSEIIVKLPKTDSRALKTIAKAKARQRKPRTLQ